MKLISWVMRGSFDFAVGHVLRSELMHALGGVVEEWDGTTTDNNGDNNERCRQAETQAAG
jgi:hypothetical protein